MGKEVLHTLDVSIGILRGKVSIDIIYSLGVGVPALSHYGFHVPSKVKAQANIAVPQSVYPGLR